MSTKYACDLCDKRFNLKIQLNKHEESEHSIKEQASNSEAGDTFDEMRSKYFELRSQLQGLDQKFQDLQLKLANVENRKTSKSSIKDGNGFDVETTKLSKMTEVGAAKITF